MTTKKQPTFSEAFNELEKLTAWFETEEVDLDEGLEKFERGLELAQICKKKLAEVENKVTTLKKKFAELDG
ncbi:MAG: exodeoxyribonuclease VII small subunit [Patescibacteria group bacterium]|nr:exodeoxyribonuclease VII small subunit [Patescibacteria group bacterium]